MCVALLRAVNAVLFISLLMPSTIGTSTGIITEAVNDADIQCLGASVNILVGANASFLLKLLVCWVAVQW